MEKASFEYIDGDSIDDELKCAICFRPLNSPICNPTCGHTFCQQCLRKWHKNSSICPTCRQRVNINDYQSVQTRAVLNQLSRLNLKCNLCEQMNINDRKKHIQICPKQIIKCTSADIQCQWKGKREELQLHLEGCSFRPIRPIIDQLIDEIQTIKKIQKEQNNFIQAFINNGYILSHLCSMSHCSLNDPCAENKPRSMPCSLCNQQMHSRQIALHSCMTMNCICKSCLADFHNQQLSPPQMKLKRKLSIFEESDDEQFERHSRSRSRSRSRSQSPF